MPHRSPGRRRGRRWVRWWPALLAVPIASLAAKSYTPVLPASVGGSVIYCLPADRPVALDLSTADVIPLRDDLVGVSRDGAWMLCADPLEKGGWFVLTDSETVSLALPLKHDGTFGPLRGWGITPQGLFAYVVGADRLEVFDLRTGSRSSWPVAGLTQSVLTAQLCDTGHEALLETGPEVYRLALASGRATALGPGSAPVSSPAGEVAYVGPEERSIVVCDRAGRARTLLSHPLLWVESVAWSPDGRYLAYSYAWRHDVGSWNSAVFRLAAVEMASGRRYRIVGGMRQPRVLGYSLTWVAKVPAGAVAPVTRGAGRTVE